MTKEFEDIVENLLTSGFELSDMEEYFSINPETFEVEKVKDFDPELLVLELLQIDEDLPSGLIDYLYEVDFFDPLSWETAVVSSPESALSDVAVYVKPEAFLREQLEVDLPEFFSY